MKLGFLKWHNFASHCPASLYRLAQNALHLEQRPGANKLKSDNMLHLQDEITGFVP